MNNSNLGLYQWITTFFKKVGGPKRGIAIILAAGGIGGSAITEFSRVTWVKKLKELTSKEPESKNNENTKIYNVDSDGELKDIIKFKEGDKYKVLQSDDNAILIEKQGDNNNPYFVSAEFLSSISDFRK